MRRPAASKGEIPSCRLPSSEDRLKPAEELRSKPRAGVQDLGREGRRSGEGSIRVQPHRESAARGRGLTEPHGCAALAPVGIDAIVDPTGINRMDRFGRLEKEAAT